MTEHLAVSETFHEPSHDELIKIARQFGGADGEALERLTGGHHNMSYRYGDAVLRHPKTPAGSAPLGAEFDFLLMYDGLPLPRAIARTAVNHTPVTLIEYIGGESKDFNGLTEREVAQLCRAMHALHSVTSDRYSETSGTPPSRSGTHGDYLLAMARESVTDRLEELARTGRDLAAYAEARELVAIGMEELTGLVADHPDEFSGQTFSLLHHDLNPGNVLWKPDGSVVFIDPNPTYGDPLDDVNYAITNNQGSAEFQRMLLGAYAAVMGGDASAVRMQAYTLKNWLDDLAWTIQMREYHPAEPEYEAAYQHRLEAVRGLLGMNVD